MRLPPARSLMVPEEFLALRRLAHNQEIANSTLAPRIFEVWRTGTTCQRLK
jgi:hypothetical protein